MKRPFLYASAAAFYIVIIVFAINAVIKADILPQQTVLIPMTMLGLFVLSAAIMGFFFLYEPLRLYFENQKKEALYFFGKVVGIFACFVALFIVLLLII